MTIYSNDMKSYGMRNGVAQFLGMPREQVRVVWMEGPQGYGRTAADDAGFEAAYLAKEIGRPVRVQWMRHEETAWDTKGPAFTFKMRGGAGRAGQPRRARLRRASRRLQSRRLQRARHGADRAAHGQAQRHAGRRQRGDAVGHVRHPEPAHGHAGREPAAGLGDAASHRKPARSQRSAGRPSPPNRSSTSWRRRRKPTRRVPPEAAQRRHRPTTAGSSARAPSPWSRRRRRPTAGTRVLRRNRRGTGDILTGRGIAYTFRSQTVVAEIAEVEVNRRTGHVWVKRLVCAHDCGLVINPEGAAPHDRGRHAALAEPRAARGSHVRHREGHQRGLDLASRRCTHADTPAQDRRRAGERRSRIRTAPICRTTAPARRRASRCSPPSPTRSTMRPAFGCAACRSAMRACSRR